MSKIVKVALLSLVFTLLSACGGGGGGGGNSPDYPFRNAFIASLVTTSQHNFSLSGNINGSPLTGSGSVVDAALVNGAFLGAASQMQISTTTGSFTVNGAGFPINQTDFSFYDFNFNYLGHIGSDFLIVSGSTFLPVTVQFGDSGVLYTGNLYTDSTFTTQIGTQSAVFSVDDDSRSDRALLTIEKTNYDLFGNVVTTTTNLYFLTLDGRLLPINSVFESATELITTSFQ